MIGQGRGVTMEPLKKIMERLSLPTGGRALFSDSVDELHVAFLHAQRVRDQRCRRRVRPSVDRWSRDPQLQLIAVSADDGASTRPRLDVHP